MILKKIVTISLITALSLSVALLISGLLIPTSVIDKLSRNKTAETQVVALDASGNPIEGAIIQQNADGTQTVVDQNGQAIAGADITTATTTNGTTETAVPTQTPTPTPTPTTPTPTPTTPTPTPSTPAPTIGSFSASPSSIAYNASSTLTWSTSNASNCSMNPGGAVATSGSKSTGVLTASTTFTLNCSGNGSATKQTSVNVAASPVSCGSPGGTCTATEVATHNSKTNCWVIYGGSYYIITNYVNNHNGGSGAFTSATCGHDITAYMNGSSNTGTSVSKHNHSGGAYNTLNSYKVGAVN